MKKYSCHHLVIREPPPGQRPPYLNPGVQVKEQCEPTAERPLRLHNYYAGGEMPERLENVK